MLKKNSVPQKYEKNTVFNILNVNNIFILKPLYINYINFVSFHFVLFWFDLRIFSVEIGVVVNLKIDWMFRIILVKYEKNSEDRKKNRIKNIEIGRKWGENSRKLEKIHK